MMIKKWIGCAALLSTALVATSCTERQRDSAERRTETAADRAEGKIDQASMTTAVKSKLAADVRMSTLTSINVDSDGTVVTLSGSVPTAEDKRQAETVATSVDGVTRVVNRLEVKP